MLSKATALSVAKENIWDFSPIKCLLIFLPRCARWCPTSDQMATNGNKRADNERCFLLCRWETRLMLVKTLEKYNWKCLRNTFTICWDGNEWKQMIWQWLVPISLITATWLVKNCSLNLSSDNVWPWWRYCKYAIIFCILIQ